MNDHVKSSSIRLCLETDPSGIYTVTSPDVPGLVTEGRTPAEILANIHDALDGLMEAWRELNGNPSCFASHPDRPPSLTLRWRWTLNRTS